MADFELSEDPMSTWGATEGYKAAWQERYGLRTPKAGATKAEWAEFASTHGGMSAEEAEASTRDDLSKKFGADQPFSGASTGEGVEGGAGTSAGPSAADPSKSGVSVPAGGTGAAGTAAART